MHGREAYRRNSYLVCYIFYKNYIFVLPQFWYGFYSAFSGQTLYEAWIYQMYNIAFSAFPIMWYSLFDYEFSKEILLSKPKKYSIGLKDECFGTYVFWRWVFYGAWQALVLCFVVAYCFGSTVAENGQTAGLWLMGTFVYFCVVLMVNVKIFNSSHTHNWGFVLQILSVAAFFGCYAFQSSFMLFPELYGLFPHQFNHAQFYTLSIFVIGVVVIADKVNSLVFQHLR